MPATFEELWKQNHERVYAGLLRAGAHQADAEDAVSEATIRAMNAFSRYDPGRASFTTWFSVICHREWLRLLEGGRRFVALDDERDVVGDEGIEDSMLRVEVEREARSEVERESKMQSEGDVGMRERLLDCVQEREAANPCVPVASRKYGVIIQELLRRAESGGSLRQVDVARAVGTDRSTACRAYAWLRGKVLEMAEEGQVAEEGETKKESQVRS